MEFRPSGTDAVLLARYTELFARCFPSATHLNQGYLEWLYNKNPLGSVVGFDAWEGERLAAHYVCVPVVALILGRPAVVLLSLNTATDPEFQGRGIFIKLAEATYARGASMGMLAVYGVANSNSTPGFVRKLGFTLVQPLDARIGIGRIDAGDAGYPTSPVAFRREWTTDSLSWRISSPARRYRLVKLGGGMVGAEARIGRPGLRAWHELPIKSAQGLLMGKPSTALHLHLGLRPGQGRQKRLTWIDVPRRFRSSPLNFIFRPLGEGIQVPEVDAVVLGQLDFDAF